jgi:hypothetical protein
MDLKINNHKPKITNKLLQNKTMKSRAGKRKTFGFGVCCNDSDVR